MAHLDNKLNILCLSNFFPEHGGGIEIVADQMATFFKDEEAWDVTLAAHCDKSSKSEYEKRPYTRLNIRNWNGLERINGLPILIPHPSDIIKVVKAIKRADFIVVHDELYITHIICLMYLAWTQKPFLVVKHTGIVTLKSKALSWLLKAMKNHIFMPLLRRAIKVVFVTDDKKKRYDPDGVLQNTVVQKNGVDMTCFYPPDEAQDYRREGIIFVGRFGRQKGIEIVRHLSKLMADIPFTMVGWGPVDPRLWQHKNVTVYEKPSRDEIAHLLRRAQVCIAPGASEGTPLVTLEATACGTPVIASSRVKELDRDLDALIFKAALDINEPAQSAYHLREAVQILLENFDREGWLAESSKIMQHNYSTAVVFKAYSTVIKAHYGLV